MNCDRCGCPTNKRTCKIDCPNCGARMSCADVPVLGVVEDGTSTGDDQEAANEEWDRVRRPKRMESFSSMEGRREEVRETEAQQAAAQDRAAAIGGKTT